jgi:hypothetical protein
MQQTFLSEFLFLMDNLRKLIFGVSVTNGLSNKTFIFDGVWDNKQAILINRMTTKEIFLDVSQASNPSLDLNH